MRLLKMLFDRRAKKTTRQVDRERLRRLHRFETEKVNREHREVYDDLVRGDLK